MLNNNSREKILGYKVTYAIGDSNTEEMSCKEKTNKINRNNTMI